MESQPDRAQLPTLRSLAAIAVVFGAIASVGLLRRAPQHPPPLLAILFVVWVFAPFGLLGAANFLSARWPAVVRTTLYVMTLLVTILSVVIYVDNNIARRTTHPAAVWVAVPPASVILAVVVLAISALRVRKDNKA